MKTIFKGTLMLCVLILITSFLNFILADPPPPPDGGSGGGHDLGGNQGGPTGAPIDGGLGILVVLAGSAGYGGLKLYMARKKEKEGDAKAENV